MTYYGTVSTRLDQYHAGYVFDLDGTVYLDDRLLPGAAETIAGLRDHGARVAFLTNKPLELPADYAAKLTRLGVPAAASDVVSSTDALLLYLRERAPDARLLVVGEPVLVDLLATHGFVLSNDPDRTDLVVVSFDRTFDYAKLLLAFRAIRAGARLVGTNPDPYCPTGTAACRTAARSSPRSRRRAGRRPRRSSARRRRTWRGPCWSGSICRHPRSSSSATGC
jgi:HAD superfamily hydrolase (TIGR01450 family)